MIHKMFCVDCKKLVAIKCITNYITTDFAVIEKCAPCGVGSALYDEFVCINCRKEYVENFIKNPPMWGIITKAIVMEGTSMVTSGLENRGG